MKILFIPLQIFALLTFLSCGSDSIPPPPPAAIVHEKIFEVTANGKKVAPNSTMLVEKDLVTISISIANSELATAKSTKKITAVILKDSDPNFEIRLDDFLSKKMHTRILKTDATEGENTYTLIAQVFTKEGAKINRFTIELRNPNAVIKTNKDVLEQDITNRLNIALYFKSPINDAFTMSNRASQYLKSTLSASNTPDIFIIFIDTLRRDYAEQWGQNMQSFMTTNVTPKHHWTSGPATIYTLFSMFHSLPSFTAYNYFARNMPQSEYGAFTLNVLQKLGYKIHTFGNHYYNCLDKYEPFAANKIWGRVLQSFFGVRSSLISLCNQPNRDAAWKPFAQTDWDDVITDQAIKDMGTIYTNQATSPHLFFISLYNAHEQYKFRNLPPGQMAIPSESDKTLQHLVYRVPHDKRDTRNFTKLRNSYANTVKFIDIQFKKIMDFIDSHKRGQDAIVIFMSDHGEMLGEKDFLLSHGHRPYRERIDGVMSFRFGQDTTTIKNKIRSEIFSTIDVFPTIFEYIKVSPLPSKFMLGKPYGGAEPSLRNSALSVRGSKHDPTHEIVMMNSFYKVYLSHPSFGQWGNDQDKTNFYKETREFRVIDITDINDNPVFDKAPFSPACDQTTKQWSSAACKKLLLEMFPDGFKELFPDG